MARIKKKEMSKHFTILFLLFQTLCQICQSLETVESHNQGEISLILPDFLFIPSITQQSFSWFVGCSVCVTSSLWKQLCIARYIAALVQTLSLKA